MNTIELNTLFTQLINLPAETECVEFKEAKQSYDFGKLGSVQQNVQQSVQQSDRNNRSNTKSNFTTFLK